MLAVQGEFFLSLLGRYKSYHNIMTYHDFGLFRMQIPGLICLEYLRGFCVSCWMMLSQALYNFWGHEHTYLYHSLHKYIHFHHMAWMESFSHFLNRDPVTFGKYCIFFLRLQKWLQQNYLSYTSFFRFQHVLVCGFSCLGLCFLVKISSIPMLFVEPWN